jgi:AraC-like DNA-binding protein
MDLISDFFERLQVRGRLFYAGEVDGVLAIDREPGTALVHLIEEGGVELVQEGRAAIPVTRPAILLCPDSCTYRIRSAGMRPAPIVCASFELGKVIGLGNPLGVERTLVFEVEALPAAGAVLRLLAAELGAGHPARDKALGVLFEYLLILVVREALARGMIERGILVGMLDPHLGKALRAIHWEPEQDWEVDALARLCGMSRSKFSARFAELAGVPPIAYLAAWRIRLAQQLMRRGTALKIVASSVGYGSQAAFTRAFSGHCGMSPGEWLRSGGAGAAPPAAMPR